MKRIDTKPRDAGEVAVDCVDLCYVQRDWRGRLEPILTAWRREIEAAAYAAVAERFEFEFASSSLDGRRVARIIRARFGGGDDD